MRTSSLIAAILAGSLLAVQPVFASDCEFEKRQPCESAKIYGEPACTWVDASSYERDGETVERGAYCYQRDISRIADVLREKGVIEPTDAETGAE